MMAHSQIQDGDGKHFIQSMITLKITSFPLVSLCTISQSFKINSGSKYYLTH